MKKLILKYCLQNAVFYGGKANPKAVLGKVLAERPELRGKVSEVRKEIEEAVKKVNTMSLDEQKRELEKIAPELMVKEEKEEKDLPEIPKAEKGKVITRFAPAPTGPLHISHVLRAVTINYLYAKKYKGRFFVRIDDTDPATAEEEFYDMILEDLEALNIKPDKVFIQSGRMERYYKYAEEMIRKGLFYVCFCRAEKFRELKLKKKECECRESSGVREWKEMLKGNYKEGEAVVRMKTSMKEENPVLRDPPMLRISEHPHPRKGKKYKVWPLYNYASVIDDHEMDITHIFRGKEHENNTRIQERVYMYMGWKTPVVINFGMIHLPGMKLHKRDIKEMIRSGKFSGWDDIRLHTVRALLRRGFVPEALEKTAIQCGLSKSDIRFTWEILEGHNRKIIDSRANRYMVVIEPVRISIQNAPETEKVEIDLHPSFPERGKKTVPVNTEKVFVSKEDFEKFKGKEVRLKGMGNVKLGKTAEYTGNKIKREMQKIQWVSEPNVRVEILTPEKTLTGLGEPEMKKLKTGEIIQMERTGFGRVDGVKEKVTVCFAHK